MHGSRTRDVCVLPGRPGLRLCYGRTRCVPGFRYRPRGYHRGMTDRTVQDRGTTADRMRATADALEEVEATLHRSAEAAPDPVAGQRLHEVGDRVTEEAHKVQRRADRLDP